jgi:hypothetical protein
VTFETLAAKAMNAVMSRQRHLHVEAAATPPAAALHESRFPAAAVSPPDDADAFETKVLTLASWPQMRHVPAQLLPAYARVCALLAYNPSVGFLVRRRLGLDGEEVKKVLQALQAAGHLRVTVCDGPGHDLDHGDAPVDAIAFPCDAAPPRRPTLRSRLLQKLLD